MARIHRTAEPRCGNLPVHELREFGCTCTCAKLGIRLVVAKTPEAKGRVERVHGTNQDRLVKKLRRGCIHTYAAANQYLLETYCPAHNARFAVAATETADFHLPLPPRFNRAHVFCLEVPRVVGNDWVVRYENRALQIRPTARAKRHTGPKARILVRDTAAGEILLVARSPSGAEAVLEWDQLSAPPVRVAPAAAPVAHAATAPAGYTRSGKPLSAKQMEARARWSQSVSTHIQRKEAQRAVTNAPSDPRISACGRSSAKCRGARTGGGRRKQCTNFRPRHISSQRAILL